MKKINITISGTSADVYDELDLSYNSKKTGNRIHENVRERFKLVKEDDKWLIIENTEY